jgi:hypothetical protein
MTFTDLTEDERLALVALLELVVTANPGLTEEESREIRKVVKAFGRDAYRQLAETIDARFRDEATLRTFLKTIDRQEAREVIYGTALEAAAGDWPVREEADLLQWLARTWKVSVRVAE